jgi:ribosomal protein S18 acetylase RimI-like enzyme
MTYSIIPIAERHIVGFHAALDSVARERLYLAFLQAPSLETTHSFVRANIREGHPQFVAEVDGAVVGWCDVIRSDRPVFRHCGFLGIGLMAQYRGLGIGRALMSATVNAALACGISRIELTVRADNTRAIALYASLGFVAEGRLRRHMHVDGRFHESLVMSLIAGEA